MITIKLSINILIMLFIINIFASPFSFHTNAQITPTTPMKLPDEYFVNSFQRFYILDISHPFKIPLALSRRIEFTFTNIETSTPTTVVEALDDGVDELYSNFQAQQNISGYWDRYRANNNILVLPIKIEIFTASNPTIPLYSDFIYGIKPCDYVRYYDRYKLNCAIHSICIATKILSNSVVIPSRCECQVPFASHTSLAFYVDKLCNNNNSKIVVFAQAANEAQYTLNPFRRLDVATSYFITFPGHIIYFQLLDSTFMQQLQNNYDIQWEWYNTTNHIIETVQPSSFNINKGIYFTIPIAPYETNNITFLQLLTTKTTLTFFTKGTTIIEIRIHLPPVYVYSKFNYNNLLSRCYYQWDQAAPLSSRPTSIVPHPDSYSHCGQQLAKCLSGTPSGTKNYRLDQPTLQYIISAAIPPSPNLLIQFISGSSYSNYQLQHSYEITATLSTSSFSFSFIPPIPFHPGKWLMNVYWDSMQCVKTIRFEVVENDNFDEPCQKTPIQLPMVKVDMPYRNELVVNLQNTFDPRDIFPYGPILNGAVTTLTPLFQSLQLNQFSDPSQVRFPLLLLYNPFSPSEYPYYYNHIPPALWYIQYNSTLLCKATFSLLSQNSRPMTLSSYSHIIPSPYLPIHLRLKSYSPIYDSIKFYSYSPVVNAGTVLLFSLTDPQDPEDYTVVVKTNNNAYYYGIRLEFRPNYQTVDAQLVTWSLTPPIIHIGSIYGILSNHQYIIYQHEKQLQFKLYHEVNLNDIVLIQLYQNNNNNGNNNGDNNDGDQDTVIITNIMSYEYPYIITHIPINQALSIGPMNATITIRANNTNIITTIDPTLQLPFIQQSPFCTETIRWVIKDNKIYNATILGGSGLFLQLFNPNQYHITKTTFTLTNELNSNESFILIPRTTTVFSSKIVSTPLPSKLSIQQFFLLLQPQDEFNFKLDVKYTLSIQFIIDNYITCLTTTIESIQFNHYAPLQTIITPPAQIISSTILVLTMVNYPFDLLTTQLFTKLTISNSSWSKVYEPVEFLQSDSTLIKLDLNTTLSRFDTIPYTIKLYYPFQNIYNRTFLPALVTYDEINEPYKVLPPQCSKCVVANTITCSTDGKCHCNSNYGGRYCQVEPQCIESSKRGCSGDKGYYPAINATTCDETKCICNNDSMMGDNCATCSSSFCFNDSTVSNCECTCKLGFRGENCECQAYKGHITLSAYSAQLYEFEQYKKEKYGDSALITPIGAENDEVYTSLRQSYQTIFDALFNQVAIGLNISPTSFRMTIEHISSPSFDPNPNTNSNSVLIPFLTRLVLTISINCPSNNPTITKDIIDQSWQTVQWKLLHSQPVLQYFQKEYFDDTIIDTSPLVPVESEEPTNEEPTIEPVDKPNNTTRFILFQSFFVFFINFFILFQQLIQVL